MCLQVFLLVQNKNLVFMNIIFCGKFTPFYKLVTSTTEGIIWLIDIV